MNSINSNNTLGEEKIDLFDYDRSLDDFEINICDKEVIKPYRHLEALSTKFTTLFSKDIQTLQALNSISKQIATITVSRGDQMIWDNDYNTYIKIPLQFTKPEEYYNNDSLTNIRGNYSPNEIDVILGELEKIFKSTALAREFLVLKLELGLFGHLTQTHKDSIFLGSYGYYAYGRSLEMRRVKTLIIYTTDDNCEELENNQIRVSIGIECIYEDKPRLDIKKDNCDELITQKKQNIKDILNEKTTN